MELTDLLDRPIAFHRPLARLAGSISAGLLLSQAVYWSRRTDDQDGWFWKTQSEWEEETCLTRREQESARALLRRLEYSGRPLWLEERRGVPAKSYFRVDFQVLGALLLDFQSGGKRHSRMAENANLDCTKTPIWNGGKRQSRLAENANLLHRIHAENTSETTTVFSGNRAKREPGKKSRIDLENFGWENLSALFSEETHQWLVKRCPTVPVEEASRAFLEYHRDRGTTFAHSRALLAAWRGWMSRAEGRAGAGGKNSATGQRGLNEAELASLRLMGVEV